MGVPTYRTDDLPRVVDNCYCLLERHFDISASAVQVSVLSLEDIDEGSPVSALWGSSSNEL